LVDVVVDETVVVVPDVGQFFGKSTGWLSCFIPLVYWGPPGKPGVAADQTVDVQVLVSQAPPKVNDSPVFTVRQLQFTWSRQLAHGTPDGQVNTAKVGLTFTVEKFENNFVPDWARSVHDLNPTE
jgi:hypothetical protein